MASASHTVRDELHGVAIFIAVIWAAFLLSLVFPSLRSFGVVPRTLCGLVGIAAAPFLHADFHHLLGNTVPLFILLALLAGSQARSFEVVIDVIVLGGSLLWVCGRPGDHIGASGLIFGLIAFLMLSGFLEKRIVPMMIAILVGFLYGGTLIWGIMPSFGSQMSWDGHLCGAIAGGIVAYVLTHESKPETPAMPTAKEQSAIQE
jgi:membrane associated rhomboid family serine protease